MSPWRSSAASSPASASLARARRSISGQRSMPSALSAPGANNSIIRPVPVPMSTSRPSGASPSARRDRRLDLALGDVERAQRVPIAGMAGEIALGGGGAVGAHRGEPGGVGRDPGILAVQLGPAVEQLEQAARCAPRGPRLRNTQLPSLRRSARPASIRILTWRETRGWLCPSTCASSPTDSSIARSSSEDAQPRRIGQSGENGDASAIFTDIKISLYRSRRSAARMQGAPCAPTSGQARPAGRRA